MAETHVSLDFSQKWLAPPSLSPLPFLLTDRVCVRLDACYCASERARDLNEREGVRARGRARARGSALLSIPALPPLTRVSSRRCRRRLSFSCCATGGEGRGGSACRCCRRRGRRRAPPLKSERSNNGANTTCRRASSQMVTAAAAAGLH